MYTHLHEFYLHSAKNGNNHPSKDEWNKYAMVHPCNGILHKWNLKKEHRIDTHNIIDELLLC